MRCITESYVTIEKYPLSSFLIHFHTKTSGEGRASQCRVAWEERFTVPNFMTLWNNHPSTRGEGPLLDRKSYENQCARNLSAAMMCSGVDFRGFRGVWSWQKNAARYPIRAQELADWLAAGRSGLPVRLEKFGGKEAFKHSGGKGGIIGRTGIVFFQNYWDSGAQGDHIDLWNGNRWTDWWSWSRVHLRIGGFGLHTIFSDISDVQKSQSVWFWHLL